MADPSLSSGEVKQILQAGLPQAEFRNRKVLLIVPDHTRTAPVGQMFQEVHASLGSVAKQIDVMVALGNNLLTLLLPVYFVFNSQIPYSLTVLNIVFCNSSVISPSMA